MTEQQKTIIDGMNEETLRKTISANFNNKVIVDYCELKLDSLKVDDALVERPDDKIDEYFQ